MNSKYEYNFFLQLITHNEIHLEKSNHFTFQETVLFGLSILFIKVHRRGKNEIYLDVHEMLISNYCLNNVCAFFQMFELMAESHFRIYFITSRFIISLINHK